MTPRPDALGTRWRVARGAALAGVVLTCGAAAHLSAGGLLPGPVPLALLALLLTWCGTRWLARPVTTARMITLVVAGQTVVHIALTALAGHRGDGVTGPLLRASTAPVVVQPPEDVWTRTHRVGSLADQLMAGRPSAVAPTFTVPAWALHLWADLQPSQLPMMLAHTAAAAVVGWWLARGEAGLVALIALAARPLAWLAAVLRSLLAQRPSRRPRVRPTGVVVLPVPRAVAPGGGTVRRGPPALLAS